MSPTLEHDMLTAAKWAALISAKQQSETAAFTEQQVMMTIPSTPHRPQVRLSAVLEYGNIDPRTGVERPGEWEGAGQQRCSRAGRLAHAHR